MSNKIWGEEALCGSMALLNSIGVDLSCSRALID